MKKILLILMMFLMLCSCRNEEERETEIPEYTFEMQSEPIDMSGYDGVTSTRHKFRIIRLSEVFRTIDEKSSGVFFIGRTNCGCCQEVVMILNEAAMECDVNIYYIDPYDEDYNLVSDMEMREKTMNYLYEILDENEEGEKDLMTPHLFTVINGHFGDSQICFDNMRVDNADAEKKTKALKKRYLEILEPFKKQ
ncbi:MAG: hypothetical protein J5365_00230 [Erysipelotrichaceae bacterium]|nr:hypothetical protein [Erysipelotrichaceae bacterium]